MRTILGDVSSLYERNFLLRYAGRYHITLVNTVEFRELNEIQISGMVGRKVNIAVFGLGRVQTESSDTFFSVCESDDMTKLRKELLLGPYDFHITLGFNPADVHGVSKGPSSLVEWKAT